ncbi:hypothetical protein Ahu01nite_022790 [Winogradskya humida]|uniref:DUF4190 domain-containing protein n=1 Tax=Winogradskya humida TaxID=113566 RepID=A0ABQ3ZLW4_9ACTN|nr:hypothetical protein Ahu01nite_022790 [Actinoplanes humidus]
MHVWERGREGQLVTQQPGSWPGQPGQPVVMAPKAGEAWTPERVDPVPGTEFGLVQLRVPPITSGLAVGALAAGIAAILVSTLVLCFGLAGSSQGWGALVAGAFALLSAIAGGGAITVGLAARRQIKRSGQAGRVRFTGGGVALAGIWCGGAGAGIAVLTLLLVVVLQSS